MLVCADARLPEIARSLSVGGVDLIINSTAWVSSGRTTELLLTPQVAYLMSARAVENGIWVVAADKVGMEADSSMYAGQSGVIDPQGKWIVQASSDREEVLVVDVQLTPAQVPVARHPVLYAELADEAEGDVGAVLRETLVPEDQVGRVEVLQACAGMAPDAFVALIDHHVLTQAMQDADVLVILDLLADPIEDRELIDALIELTATPGSPALYCTVREQCAVDKGHVGYFCAPEASRYVMWRHTSAPGMVACALGMTFRRFSPRLWGGGDTAVLVGAEGLVPELVRGLMLRGADTVLWSAGRFTSSGPATGACPGGRKSDLSCARDSAPSR